MEAETPLQAPALSLPAQPHPLPALQQPARRASRSLCSPPEGAFSYDSSELAWEEGTYASTRFHSVNIPADRIQDFVLGENARGQTSFCVFKSERPWKAEQASQKSHRQARDAIAVTSRNFNGHTLLLTSLQQCHSICAGLAIQDQRAQQSHILVSGEWRCLPTTDPQT